MWRWNRCFHLHPAVNEWAVVGRPDKFLREMPCAFVSLKEKTAATAATAEEITEFCKGKLPRFMVPKPVVFKEELPKTSTGKIQKNVVRKVCDFLLNIEYEYFEGVRYPCPLYFFFTLTVSYPFLFWISNVTQIHLYNIYFL